MKKLFSIVAIAIALVSCANKNDIADLQNQINQLKSDQIASIDSQIKNITASLARLESMDGELKGYIETLQQQREGLVAADENLSKSIEELRTELNDKIDSEKSARLAALEEYKSELTAKISSIDANITALQEKDAELERKITDLKAYVDTELKNAKSWVSATFATLEQYSDLCETVAGIQAQIAAINSSIKTLSENAAADKEELTKMIDELSDKSAAIQNAISELETSLKSWVNEKLTGYYTIAQMDAKIELLKQSQTDGDEALAKEIEALESALAQAKVDMTSAYQRAINEVITELEGKINEKIAADINAATAALQSQINDINSKIKSIEEKIDGLNDRLTALEELIKEISYISYVPSYADHQSVMWYYIDGNEKGELDTLNFEIRPNGTVEKLLKSKDLKLEVGAVYNTIVKSSIEMVDLPVVSQSGDGNILSVVVSGEKMRNAFFTNHEGASCRLLIAVDGTEKMSDYIQMRPALKGPDYFINVTPSPLVAEASQSRYVLNVESNCEWTAISNEDWASIDTSEGTGNATVTVSVLANPGTAREATVHFQNDTRMYSCDVTVKQARGVVNIPEGTGTKESPYNAAQANEVGNALDANAKTPSAVYVRGFVKKIKTVDTASDFQMYHNMTFYISVGDDLQGEDFYCYQMNYAAGTKFTDYNSLTIGDDVVLCCQITRYVESSSISTVETVGKGESYLVSINGVETNPIGVMDVTVAEFNAAPVGSQQYRLTGKVSADAAINTTYGNFELVDATGAVFVYGLSNIADIREKLLPNANIVIVGTRGEYNGKIEVSDAVCESIEGGDEPEPSEPEPSEDTVYNATDFTWSENTDVTYGSGYQGVKPGAPTLGYYRYTCTTSVVAQSGDHIRIYKGCAFTVSSEKEFTKLVMTVTAANYAVGATVLVGGGAVEADNTKLIVTWEGPATKELVLHATEGQIRASKFEFVFGEGVD